MPQPSLLDYVIAFICPVADWLGLTQADWILADDWRQHVALFFITPAWYVAEYAIGDSHDVG